MTTDKLLDLLAFQIDLDTAEIIKEDELTNSATFLVANLTFDNGYTMTVPFVYYPDNDWIFTPCDWQGWLPMSADDIDKIGWRVNDTDTEGVMFDGLPMLAPWIDEIRADIKTANRKRIGIRLRELRENKGLTTRQLAELTGLSNSHITRIESGRYAVTIDSVAVIAEALGAEMEIAGK